MLCSPARALSLFPDLPTCCWAGAEPVFQEPSTTTYAGSGRGAGEDGGEDGGADEWGAVEGAATGMSAKRYDGVSQGQIDAAFTVTSAEAVGDEDQSYIEVSAKFEPASQVRFIAIALALPWCYGGLS